MEKKIAANRINYQIKEHKYKFIDSTYFTYNEEYCTNSAVY